MLYLCWLQVVAYYAATSLLGVTEALIWVNIFRPGERYTGGAVAGELDDGETYGTDSKTIVEVMLRFDFIHPVSRPCRNGCK